VAVCGGRARKLKFALKIIDKASCRGKEQQIVNEVSILRRLRHGNIVQLIEDFDTPHRLYMVMELVTVGLLCPESTFLRLLHWLTLSGADSIVCK